jgi:hypothetical protein
MSPARNAEIPHIHGPFASNVTALAGWTDRRLIAVLRSNWGGGGLPATAHAGGLVLGRGSLSRVLRCVGRWDGDVR